VHLLGRIAGIQDGKLFFAPDLKENLNKNDQAELKIIRSVDEYIAKNGISAPEESLPALRDGYDAPEVLSLDPNEAGITSIIWTMGYHFDFSLVHLPVLDESGYPVAPAGTTAFTGLYSVGLPWQPMQRNGLILSVGETARTVAETISNRVLQSA
jgi:putative flavoprotein involved in K+ transport